MNNGISATPRGLSPQSPLSPSSFLTGPRDTQLWGLGGWMAAAGGVEGEVCPDQLKSVYTLNSLGHGD